MSPSLSPDKKKILVFRLGAMGDILFTTPALRGLKAEFPDSHLTYLTLKQWRFVVRNNPNVDRVIGIPYCHPKVLGPLVQERFDIVINIFESEDAARLCAAIPAVERRGNVWDGDRIVPDSRGFLLSGDRETRFQEFRNGLSRAELSCRVAGVTPETLHYEYYPGKCENWRAGMFLTRKRLKRPIAIHLHSRGSSSRSWTPMLALEVVRRFPRERFLILGYRKDRVQTRLFKSEPNCVITEHSMPIQAALLARCLLFVGIDSGPRNMASAVGTPLLWLSGPVPKSIMPLLPNERNLSIDEPCAPCFQEDCPLGRDCLGHIPTERIVETVQEMLREA
ncbi:glycosyltransferase family 9 protein [bacterium]|nr:glycosyltransferase family 9 protein [bacterium]